MALMSKEVLKESGGKGKKPLYPTRQMATGYPQGESRGA